MTGRSTRKKSPSTAEASHDRLDNFGTSSFLRNKEHPERVNTNHLLLKEIKMDNRELLAKQLWSVSSPPQNSTIMGLTIIAVFLAGIGIGDVLSKSKQANTNYAAMDSRIAEAPP
jgi:hypothetical protein